MPNSRPSEPTLLFTLRAVWTLLFGIGLLMVANGLQGSLLGIRAEAEGFAPASIGLIMSGFFVGLLAGSLWTPSAVRLVGHVRVFAAMSAIASVSILLHALFVDELSWWVIRCVTGFCYAGILVVAESWLNDRAPEETRGQILALYMAVSFGGVAASQMLLTLASSEEATLYMLVSILISLAVVPLLLRSTPLPDIESGTPISMKELVSASPLGVFGMFIAGLANGTVFGMGAVYARSAGFSVPDTALFMALLTIGAAVLQWPIGKLSDRFDRRIIMAIVAALAVAACLAATGISAIGSLYSIVLIILTGGVVLSIHTLSLAYTNSYLKPEQMVGASSSLVLILGAGSVIGPIVSGAAISFFGPPGFFIWLASCHASFVTFAIWRMRQRAALPSDEQALFVPTPFQGAELSTAYPEESVNPHD
ncbi:MFS transporter [Granulosicoccus antarcticus]|uniref:Putative MFS-type transporter YcaD n=1 Tax=Granulosicoccus antarcticus IMCC3135 TaxID=1192854 RepID=A0A2Z2P1N1_9GAMM|nr:MFS transporter [Granulosicoccus antarcticus]ASJ76745.1 putative MFS-type transporter YcaD [Granulosicoccus antarcticus IMCC3135]